MTDQELSNLLTEWKPTPAPATLDERVFGPRPLPVPWWNRIPAGPIAGLGTMAGALLVWLLSGLVQTEPVAAPPPPAPVKQEVIPEAPPPVKEVPRPKAKQTKPRPRPAPVPVTRTPTELPPRLVTAPAPAYPANAPPLVSPVTIRVRIWIGKDGRVTDAQALDGDPTLAALAEEAVKDWHYEPLLLNGEPAEATTEVTVSFGPRPVPREGRGKAR